MQLPIDPPAGERAKNMDRVFDGTEMCVWTGVSYLPQGTIQAHIFLLEDEDFYLDIYLKGKQLRGYSDCHTTLDDALKETRRVFARERKIEC